MEICLKLRYNYKKSSFLHTFQFHVQRLLVMIFLLFYLRTSNYWYIHYFQISTFQDTLWQ